MHLQLRTGRDGKLRSRWYGAAQVDGRRVTFPLCRWAGTPPATGKGYDAGDAAFEASRGRAMDELRDAVGGLRTEADRDALHERALSNRYRVKVGRSVPLSELAARWLGIERKRPIAPRYAKTVRATLEGFAAHLSERFPKVRALDAVTPAAVRSWLALSDELGLSAKTHNDRLGLLRGVFRRFAPYAPAAAYLKNIPFRESETVPRVPYNPEELRAILRAAQADDLLRGPVTCAICTGMRRADCAGLRWRSVDLDAGFIVVRTGKTGAVAEVPIFPPLRVELERARAGARITPGAFVWPDAARMLADGPTGLDWRLKRILCRALTPAGDVAQVPALPPADLRDRARVALVECAFIPSKAERAGRVLDAYLSGASMKQTAARVGAPLSFVSNVLNAVERRARVPVLRRAGRAVDRSITVAADVPEGIRRARRASAGGWHAFRTSWATLALQAGVPPELVARCTAHTTTRTLTRHYFQPRRDALRDALDDAGMAKLLG